MDVENKLSPTNKYINYIGATVLALNSIWISLYSLKVAVEIYKTSLMAGLVLTFSGILFTLAFPFYMTVMSYEWFSTYERINNKYERTTKRVLTFLGVLIGAWLLYLLIAFLLLVVTNWLA